MKFSLSSRVSSILIASPPSTIKLGRLTSIEVGKGVPLRKRGFAPENFLLVKNRKISSQNTHNHLKPNRVFGEINISSSKTF